MVTLPEQKDLLNQVYKAVTVQTLDEINRLKKPSKYAFEACRLLCLFLNTFREANKKWPAESFSSWVTVQHYLVGSPSVSKICQEITMTKRLFIKPFSQRMNHEVCTSLRELVQDFMRGQSEEQVLWQYMGHKSMKAIVHLVLVSVQQITDEHCVRPERASIDPRSASSKHGTASSRGRRSRATRPSSNGKLDIELNTITPHDMF